MSPTLLLLLAWIVALLVLHDARRRKRCAPILWAAAALIFWIAALPAYL